MGVRPESKSFFEKTAEFASKKFCMSLGRGREPSNLRWSGLTPARSIRILVRTLDPQKRLNIDEVAGAHRGEVPLDRAGQGQQLRVGRTVWARHIGKWQAVLREGASGDVRLQEEMDFRLGKKAEHGGDGPGEDACLAPRQPCKHPAPTLEALISVTGTMQ